MTRPKIKPEIIKLARELLEIIEDTAIEIDSERQHEDDMFDFGKLKIAMDKYVYEKIKRAYEEGFEDGYSSAELELL